MSTAESPSSQNPSTSLDRALLERLQEELQTLKNIYRKRIGIKKTPQGASPTAPLPVAAIVEVLAPPQAEAYDIQSFQVEVVVDAAGVVVHIWSPVLPVKLCQLMAATLQAQWEASCGSDLVGSHSRLHLDAIFAAANANFVQLITSLPEALEAYETVDAAGTTVRRYAFVSADQPAVLVENLGTAAAQPGAPARRTLPAATHGRLPSAQHAAASSSGSQGKSRPSWPSKQDPASLRAQLASGPAALAREMVFLQRRYGPAFLPRAPASAERVPVLDRQPLAGDGRPGATGAAGTDADSETSTVQFQLDLQPTDPAWQRSALRLHAEADAAAYPAPGSLRIRLPAPRGFDAPGHGLGTPQAPASVLAQARQQQHGGSAAGRKAGAEPVSEGVRLVLERMVAAEVAQLAGRADALRTVVRWLDTRAGQLAQEADDVLLEVMRERARLVRAEGLDDAAVCQQLGDMRLSEEARGRAADPGAAPGQEPVSDHEGRPGNRNRVGRAGVGSRHNEGRLHRQAHPQNLEDADVQDASSYSTGAEDSQSHSEETDEWSSDELSALGQRLGAASHSGLQGTGGAKLELRLEDLKLDGVDVLEACLLCVQVACARCRTTGQLSLATDAVAQGQAAGGGTRAEGECPTCHRAWSLAAALRLAHAGSNLLAVLSPAGCSPADLLPSMLAGQCSACSGAIVFRTVQIGAVSERQCSRCHARAAVQLRAASFVPPAQRRQVASAAHGAPVSNAAGRHAAGTRGDGSLAASPTPGQALPSFGACKHYRHSYRWLRFPCCGRRFPCDLCHEEGVPDGHAMKWALRMVCGYCSLEQPVAQRCSGCNKRLAGPAKGQFGARTRFWEGGEGCRDPRRMDRRDARKHRGSRLKTRSKKDTRVGPEAAARRREEAQAG